MSQRTEFDRVETVPAGEPNAAKRRYTPPRLKELGSVEELTLGGATGSPDGEFNQT
jgi:hypothetical protein